MSQPGTRLSLVLEHVFDIRIDFHQRLIFDPMPGGQKQAYTSVKSGRVSGPRLNGTVLDYSGADWPIVRTDGVVELNAHYVLEADDGARIYIRNLGYVYGPRADAARCWQLSSRAARRGSARACGRASTCATGRRLRAPS